ncbi:MAG: DUF1294 domain-containing protein [Bacilli bacterium]|nr:DUF1294 domain-containing protein [Bacilli bacterium]
MNVLTFIIYGLDKLFAIKNMSRVSENTLLLLSFIGGSIGAYIGMKFFHHKTNKKKFTILVPLMIIMHIALFLYLYK